MILKMYIDKEINLLLINIFMDNILKKFYNNINNKMIKYYNKKNNKD